MKRLPLVASFLLFIALCASAAYWAMQLFKPPVRPVTAPPRAAVAEVRPEAAAALFGGKSGPAAVASNYQLRGIILSGSARDSVAILSADGKPAQAIRVNAEVAPGVTVKEVHRDHVLLAEGGVTKRVELPESAKSQNGLALASPAQTSAVQTPPNPPAPARPPQLTAPAPMTTAPPTTVISPPSPVQQPGLPGNVPAPTAPMPPPVMETAPQPAVPQTPTIPPATSGTTSTSRSNSASGTTASPAPVMPSMPATTPPAVAPANQVPPETPGPRTPLRSR